MVSGKRNLPELILASFFFILCSCSATNTSKGLVKEQAVIEQPNKTQLYLEFPEEDEVLFFGKISSDQADALSGNMMYPGDNAGVFLVSVLTHAAIQSSINEKNREKQQTEADTVLENYQQTIEKFDGDFLLTDDSSITTSNGKVTLKRYKPENDTLHAVNRFVAKILPVYYLTQNENTLVLNIQFNFYESKNPQTAVNQKIVEYVSDPIISEKNSAIDAEQKQTRFIESGRKLFGESVRLALEASSGNLESSNNIEKTVRYFENGRKKVERGTILEDRCDRIVFTTLRGVVKSVPKLDHRKTCIARKSEK